MITIAEADALAAQGEYKPAAALYARCNKPFEQVALIFVDNHETDALRLYLTQKLINLGRNVTSLTCIPEGVGCDTKNHDINLGNRVVSGQIEFSGRFNDQLE